MSVQIRDTISPALARALAHVSNPVPVLEAMGLQLVSITKRAFNEAELRATPWAPLKAATLREKIKHGKSEAILKRETVLIKSIHVTGTSSDHVTVGCDPVYAAIQQLGSAKASGRGSGIPPRPFFPFSAEGKMTAIAEDKIKRMAMAKLEILLGK